jgi:hypothetical protein
MTSLNELKVMVDKAIEQVHGSPVADQPIVYNGDRQIDISIQVEKLMNKNTVKLSMYAD